MASKTWDSPCVYFQINGKPTPVDLRLIDLELDQTADMIHKAVFTFENGDRRLESQRLGSFLQLGNTITFTHGYLNRMSKPRTFEIKGHEGWLEMKVICYPKVKNANKTYSRTFKDSKYSTVAKLMGAEMGLKKITVKETDCKERSLKQTNETNPKFLSDAAKKLNFEFGMEDDELIFRPYNYTGKPVQSYFWMGGTAAGDILEFEPKKNIFQIPSAIKTLWIDPKTGQPKPIESTASSVPRELLGGVDALTGGLASIILTGGTSMLLPAPPPTIRQIVRGPNVVATETATPGGNKIEVSPIVTRSRSRSKEKAQCHTEDQFKVAENSILEAKLVVIGDPDLKDKIVITLGGLGPLYDGNWYVKRATHKVFAGTVECLIIRNASPKPTQTTTKPPPKITQGAPKFANPKGGRQNKPKPKATPKRVIKLTRTPVKPVVRRT